MEIKRYENETEDELIYRICSNKELIGSWQDVADTLNDLLSFDYTESKYRKQFQSFEKMLNANKEKFYDNEELLKELDKKYEDIRKEKIKLQTANLERSRIDRSDARWELFYENIGKYIQSKDVPKFNVNNNVNNDNNIEYLLGIADVHCGALWSTPSNEYSTKIVRDRFEILLEYTENFIKEKNLKKFNIILLGDLIDGVLRISNLQAQDTKVAKACSDISEIIGEFVERITIDCKCHINLYDAVYGNHSTQRYLGQTKNYDLLEDLGYTISRYIKCYLRNNENVTIFVPNEGETCLEFELNGFNMIAFHGHQIKDLNNAIKNLTMRNRKFYDYSLSGHIHSDAEITEGVSDLHDVQDIRFPSMCGADPYSDSIFKQSKGSAKIVGFEKDYGYTFMQKFILN